MTGPQPSEFCWGPPQPATRSCRSLTGVGRQQQKQSGVCGAGSRKRRGQEQGRGSRGSGPRPRRGLRGRHRRLPARSGRAWTGCGQPSQAPGRGPAVASGGAAPGGRRRGLQSTGGAEACGGPEQPAARPARCSSRCGRQRAQGLRAHLSPWGVVAALRGAAVPPGGGGAEPQDAQPGSGDLRGGAWSSARVGARTPRPGLPRGGGARHLAVTEVGAVTTTGLRDGRGPQGEPAGEPCAGRDASRLLQPEAGCRVGSAALGLGVDPQDTARAPPSFRAAHRPRSGVWPWGQDHSRCLKTQKLTLSSLGAESIVRIRRRAWGPQVSAGPHPLQQLGGAPGPSAPPHPTPCCSLCASRPLLP